MTMAASMAKSRTRTGMESFFMGDKNVGEVLDLQHIDWPDG